MSDARARRIGLELELELVWRLVLDGGVWYLCMYFGFYR